MKNIKLITCNRTVTICVNVTQIQLDKSSDGTDENQL